LGVRLIGTAMAGLIDLLGDHHIRDLNYAWQHAIKGVAGILG
jgi:hypothetical protein